MVTVPFLLAVLLPLPAAPVGGAASPALTFEDRDPVTGKPVKCDRCPPGTYLRASCSSTRESECAPCPQGSFTELWNHIGKCLRCGVCGHNQVVKTACTARSDCRCQCKPGFYFRPEYDMCVRHSDCPTGAGLQRAGTPHEDTVCQICSNGTYSDISSAHQNCSEHRRCSNGGLQQALKGATWHDSVCANCRELKDGADYLKEILPAFFIRHKITIKRLRRIVHRLPSEDGRKQGGTSELDSSQLRARINAWVESATAKQVRELPGILSKAGAIGAGERLQNKLQRVDGVLRERCGLGNEVDAGLVSA